MEYICSDTNVWIDYSYIKKLDIPFRLECTYIMHQDAIEDEIKQPVDLKDQLIKLGLVAVELTTEEFFYADSLGEKYRRLSKHDRTALAIAAHRDLILLTGDRNLRKAAEMEGVRVLGTIGLLDRLLATLSISLEEYCECLKLFHENNGIKIRLPEEELEKRLQFIRNEMDN